MRIVICMGYFTLDRNLEVDGCESKLYVMLKQLMFL